MKIVNKPKFEIGIHKSGKWYWKPEWCLHNANFHKVENGVEFKFINTWSYFVPTVIQLFIFKLIFYIEIKPELISGNPEFPQRYVKLEDTHLALMDTPVGSWDQGKTLS